MHNCEDFRERITEHIIDRKDLSANAEFQREFLICSSCSDFYAESRDMIDAISSVNFEFPEEHWQGMTARLRMRIQAEEPAQSPAQARISKFEFRNSRRFFQWAEVAAAAALVLVTIGLYTMAVPDRSVPAARPAEEFAYVDQTLALDPVTVDFLEESELLLRNVMNIEVTNAEEVAEAQKMASAQLADIRQRRDAAAEVPPVVDVIDTYETVLRDIRNLSGENAAEDIADIRSRIQENALIANMKAFQPTVSMINFTMR